MIGEWRGLRDRVILLKEVRMPRPLPIELRVRAVKAYLAQEGTYAEIGARFGVGEASVNRWVSRFRATGEVAALPAGGQRPRKITPKAEEHLRSLVEDEPNWTTSELAEQLREDFGIDASRHAVGRALRRLNLTFKRGSSGRQIPSDP